MMKLKIDRAYSEVVLDEDPDTSWLDQTPKELGSLEAAVANRRRKLALERGDFHFVGVRAVVETTYETEQGGWIRGPKITTPGLWNIESDSSLEYLVEVAAEEADQLDEMLEAHGVSVWKRRYAVAIAKSTLEPQ